MMHVLLRLNNNAEKVVRLERYINVPPLG